MIKFLISFFCILTLFYINLNANITTKHIFIPRSWMSIDELINAASEQSEIKIISKIADSELKYVLYDNLTNLKDVIEAIREYYYYVLGVDTEVFHGIDSISITALPKPHGVEEAMSKQRKLFKLFNLNISKGIVIIKEDLVEILPISIIKQNYVYQQDTNKKFSLLPKKYHVRKIKKNYYDKNMNKIDMKVGDTKNTNYKNDRDENKNIKNEFNKKIEAPLSIQQSKFSNFLNRLYSLVRSSHRDIRMIKAIQFTNPSPHSMVIGASDFSLQINAIALSKNHQFSMMPSDDSLNLWPKNYPDLPGLTLSNIKFFRKEEVTKYLKNFKLKITQSSGNKNTTIEPLPNSTYKKGFSRSGKKTKSSLIKFFSKKMFPRSTHEIEIIRKPLRRTTLRAHRKADSIFDNLNERNTNHSWNLRKNQ